MPVPELPRSRSSAGGVQPRPAAVDDHRRAVVLHLGPEGHDGAAGAGHVVAGAETGDGGGALGQGGQEQRPVGDGLVPGDGQGAGQGPATAHRHGVGGTVRRSGSGGRGPAHRIGPTGVLVAR